MMLSGMFASRSGGGGGTVYCKWDTTVHGAGITISGGGLIATNSSYGLGIARGDIALSGKMYFEVGYAPNADSVGVGVCTSSQSMGNWLGQDAPGGGYYLPSNDFFTNGAVVYNGTTDSATPVITGIAFDATTRKLWIRNSAGTAWEGGGDPVAGTSPTYTMPAGTYFPACTPYSGASACTLNAGQSAFAKWTPSGGFSGVK